MVLSFMLHGCASKYSVVEFEILEPANVEFPDHVNRLLILNRAPITLDIWSDQNQIGMDARQLVLLDTLIINNLFRGVRDVLRNSPAEKYRIPIWLSDRRTDTALLEDRILTRREVENICDTIGGDAIISLEFYSVGLEQHFDYYKDAPDEVQNHYYEAYNSLKWNIHLPGSPRPFDSYTTIDTLFFSAIIDGEMLPFVPGVDMLRSLFYESGQKYGSYLVPVWNYASRYLYRGRNDSLKLAVKHTDEGDWESAFSIWNNLSTLEDSTLVAKAYHNMAVYYELEDNLDSASMMLDLALEHAALESDTLYREELEVRILNRKDIQKQVY
ncbi:MAG: hypothetical protein IMY68_09745 [Bacteroidetes bacterium]|nr:hypothetical protein [Bacteroidota bacterium]